MATRHQIGKRRRKVMHHTTVEIARMRQVRYKELSPVVDRPVPRDDRIPTVANPVYVTQRGPSNAAIYQAGHRGSTP
jgi:hypothetical protein